MKKTIDRGLIQEAALVFEQGSKGRKGYSLPRWDVEEVEASHLIPSRLLRKELEGFPQLSEVDVVRHFTRLSQWNYGVDSGLYPLGSCTMKYNPKVNEEVARMAGFAHVHPYTPEDLSQGVLRLMVELQGFLAEITGMDHVSLQPAAGAHGELRDDDDQSLSEGPGAARSSYLIQPMGPTAPRQPLPLSRWWDSSQQRG
jgi:glycine dehydrogenase subunit 2